MTEVLIYGFRVSYDDTARYAISYLLHDLDQEEAKVFFEQAKLKGYCKFEDDREGDYLIAYNKDNTYTLIKR